MLSKREIIQAFALLIIDNVYGGKCAVSGRPITTVDDLVAIDWHHPTEKLNYFDGDVVHETKKCYRVSGLANKAVPWDKLVKMIVREFVRTVPIFLHSHRLIHLVMRQPNLMEEFGADYPFELVGERLQVKPGKYMTLPC